VRHTVFGAQEVRTRVYHVLPEETPRLDLIGLLRGAGKEAAPAGAAPAAGAAREEPWVL
jgi:hypothetical protein